MIKKSAAIISILIMISFWAKAHKFYTSLTQVEYNSKTGSAEVIMNLFTDDLELALSNHNKRKIRSSDTDFSILTYQYLDVKFGIKNAKNHQFRNQYVGLELKHDMVSIYFEIKVGTDISQVVLKQISLLETNKEQTNIVNLKNGKARTSLVFKAGNPDIQPVHFNL